MKPAPQPARRHSASPFQSGVSLLETMVGLTIGLLVSMAALSTLMVTRQSSSTISENYRLATAGNTTLRLIAYTIRQAGAVEIDQSGGVNTPVMFGDSNNRAVNGDQLVSGTEGGVNPDGLTVSYQHRADGVTRDCLGATPAAGAPIRIDNTFSVTQVELRCAGSVNPGAPQALIGDNGRPNEDIAVEDFQVWYWMQNAAGQQRRVTQTDVAANGGWPNVEAVEVCLQLRGVRADYPVTTFTNCREAATASGGQLHQVFRGTYKLRNRYS